MPEKDKQSAERPSSGKELGILDDIRETLLPIPVWLGPIRINVSGMVILEKTAPATCPEYMRPA